MKVEVISSLNEVRSTHVLNKTVIVIDVLRATSTIVTALAHGFTEVIPVETIGQAKNLKESGRLLAGERYCKKIEGFDMGSSPSELIATPYDAGSLVLTTTNGTKAIHKALKAQTILIGSLLNATASARKAVELKREVTLICSGTGNEFALEDGLCAGLIVDSMLSMDTKIEVCDLGVALHAAYNGLRQNLPDTLMRTASGKRLLQLGFSHDIELCAQVDKYNITPIMKNERIILSQ